jgi:phosphatidylinositol-3-phosphatase
MSPYQHIFVIVAENKGYDELMGHPEWTPVIHRLAEQYGIATEFYGEVHSSEGNYLAMLAGDTFGIHNDDAFYCHAGVEDAACKHSSERDYPDYDLKARSLMDQLTKKGLSWKAYLEDIPAPGSLVPNWPTPDYPSAGLPNELYAAKHNGFVNFRSVNQAPYPELASHFVGFRQLARDLAAGTMPSYAHIIPNECNDMHGLTGQNVPRDCEESDVPALIRRGDTEIGMLVSKIMQSRTWSDPGNTAIVVTFDENNNAERYFGAQGCCGYDPKSIANFGGGHIVTIVITNHGPRHVADSTPYNHYSLLRTTEAAFGINEYLAHAADRKKGVVTMNPLFDVAR